MTRFDVDWLDLRSDADARARDGRLLQSAADYVADRPGSLIVDLGAGTGSAVRALHAKLRQPAHWRLVDADPALLAAARERCADLPCEYLTTDLVQPIPLPIDGARLVIASALLDLASAAWIGRLATEIATTRCAFYAPLNFDGAIDWTPVHEADDSVRAAFNLHQRNDKGFGPALGSAAVPFAAAQFRDRGYTVHLASSPWLLSASDATLLRLQIEGIAAAAEETGTIDASTLNEWRAFRLSPANQNSCQIGHQDLLALPT